MCISSPRINTYDQVAYPSRARADAQCHRLETIATLFGLMPVPSAHARVLELGCGSGENLAAQALAYPGAQFVGCDASARAIAAAAPRSRRRERRKTRRGAALAIRHPRAVRPELRSRGSIPVLPLRRA